jgi:hypothetical protein
MLSAIAVLCGCGSSGNASKTGGSVTLTPNTGLSMFQGSNLTIQARVDNASPDAGVIWSLSGDGALVNPTSTSVTYIAPNTTIANANVVVTATSTTTPSSQSYIPITLLPLGTYANVQPISVDGGPVSGKVFPNTAYTTVTVCAPGTTTCQAIDGIIVDTGSSGLRILASALPDLPTATADGNPISECVQLPDQSYLWGDLVTADIRIAGEVSRSLPIHALTTANGASVPSGCTDNGARTNRGTQASLHANGILGLGYQPQDCGGACASNGTGTAPEAAYYTCSGSSCPATFVPLAQQIKNPIVTFLNDNNGVVLQLPGLPGPSPTLDGVMTFGIGTQGNNQLGSATVFTVSAKGTFTTNLASTGQSLTSSVLSSGARALFFPDDDLPACSGASPYFCPAASTPISAVQVGANAAQATINFNVDNAVTLFAGNPGAAAFTTLAGPNGSGACATGTGACQFIWGLPFFYGRTVYTAINGQTMPMNAPAAPWFAYTTSFSMNSVHAQSTPGNQREMNRDTK